MRHICFDYCAHPCTQANLAPHKLVTLVLGVCGGLFGENTIQGFVWGLLVWVRAPSKVVYGACLQVPLLGPCSGCAADLARAAAPVRWG